MSASTRLLLIFGLVSLAAVGTGAFVCEAGGVPAASWMRNLAAWAAGALAAGGVMAAARAGAVPAALVVAPLGLLATFFNADQAGVHRWIDLGPLHVNVAMLLLPAGVVALAALGRERRWPCGAAFAVLILLVLQPDASQTTAWGVPMMLVAAVAAFPPAGRVLLVAGAGVLVAVAWFRPDPLEPVAEVEEVIGLAYAVSPAVAGLALLLLAAAAAAPVIALRSAEGAARLAALALGLMLLLWSITPVLGAFPVPWVGIGMSPIVGSWLGVGLLAGLLQRRAAGFSRRFG